MDVKLNADTPQVRIEALMPSFYRLLSSVLKKDMDDTGRVGMLTVFNLWELHWDGLTTRGVESLSAKNTSRVRKLSDKISKFGADSKEVKDYLHRVITHGQDFMVFIDKMLLLQKQGKYVPELAVGTNLIFLLLHFFDDVVKRVFVWGEIVEIQKLGVYWRGLRHRYSDTPEKADYGCLQFLPAFVKVRE